MGDIRFEVDGAIAVITNDNPEKHNAFDDEMDLRLFAILAVRLLHGLAISSFYPSATTLTADISPDSRRAEALSYFSMFLYAGFAVGPGFGVSSWECDRRTSDANYDLLAPRDS